jgi:hypothetical protein
MANNFAPTVTVKNSNVEIGASVLFKDLFEVNDLDGNAITRYRFRDNGSASYSGFFSLAGAKQIAGGWVEITAAQLNSVTYSAALLLDSESIGVQVYDGKFWSSAAFGVMNTVNANNRPPVVTTQNGEVLETEMRAITDLISVYDPDEYPITKYYLVDRANYASSGYLTLRGTRLASAQWHLIEAADLPAIRYVGGSWGPDSEKVGVMAFDGKKWSEVSEFSMLTTPNQFKPVVGVYTLQGGVGSVIEAQSMFTVSDADGNTMKMIRFLDTGVAADSGFFTVNGVRQASGTFFELPFQQLSAVRYNYSAFAENEQYQVQVYDGRYWSDLATGSISAVVKPRIEFSTRSIVLDELEEVPASSLFTRGDAGPPLIQYQVVDLTSGNTTAKFSLNGNDFLPNSVYSLSAADFANLQVKGGANDLGRSFDNMVVRAYNGTFWTNWEKFNVSTEPVADKALYSGTHAREDFNAATGKWRITYGFIPNGTSVPNYYADDAQERDGTIALSASQREMVRSVFQNYQTYFNLEFVERPFNILGDDIDIVIGANTQDGSQAYAYLPAPWTFGGIPLDRNPQSDIWFSNQGPTDPNNPDNTNGGYGRLTFVHELGHALGLKHPFENPPTLPTAVDFHRNSVMSYSSTPGRNDYPMTPMLYDIMALQTMYGANKTFRTGNDTYVYELANTQMQALWDGGGEDTINMGNQTRGGIIDLREGRLSSLNGVADSLWVPYGCVIENARGTRDSDTMFGNEIRNLLFGNEGNDRFVGNGGDDVLRGGIGNDTYVWSMGDGNDVVREESNGGREIIEISDPIGRLNALEDDFIFRKFGRDLRIDMTFNQGESLGSVVIKDMAWGGSRVETLRFVDSQGNKIGNDIDLNSVFVQSTDVAKRFQVTNSQTQFGYIATPV